MGEFSSLELGLVSGIKMKNKKEKRKNLFSLLLVVFFILFSMGFGVLVQAKNIGDRILGGLETVGWVGYGAGDVTGGKMPVIHPAEIGFGIIFIFVGVVGMFFFGLMLYSGYLWLTAYGDEDKAGKARKVARRAVVGLGVVMAAYIITIAAFYYISRVAGGKYYYPEGGTADWRDHESGYEEDIYW